jgi:TrmH family RNA methyltransferase
MKPALITSVHNPRVKAAARLRERHGRDDQGRIIIDGVREIHRAIVGGVRLLEVYCFSELCRDHDSQSLLGEARKAGADVYEVTPHVMGKLAFGQRVEGVVAVAEPPQRTLADLRLSENPLVAVVEGAEKPGNLGAILRTADAAGLAATIVADPATDLYNPNVLRASLGAVFTVPVCACSRPEALAWLVEQEFKIFTARVDGSIPYSQADFRGRVAIVLGSEAHGLSDLWRGDHLTPIQVPLLGQVDSLNLSATAAVLFYEALRQRSL